MPLIAIVKKVWLEIVILGLIIITSGYTGYEIGRQSVIPNKSLEQSGLAVVQLDSNDGSRTTTQKQDTIATINANVDAENSVYSSSVEQTNLEIDVPDNTTTDMPEIVYGSVNGTKYYNYGCKAGNRIKSENRIYFTNTTEAQQAGYEPAQNCNF